MKAWTEDEYPMQAHPRSDRAFTDFLRRRAAENMAAYERSQRPAIEWTRVLTWLTVITGSVAVWAFALYGLARFLLG